MADPEETKTTKTLIVSLPVDIISNILSRLPVEDVTRFKTVNKEWYDLISSLHFSHLHFISHSPHFQDHIVFFVGKHDGCLYFFTLDFSDSFNPKQIHLPSYFFTDIYGSCNGLLLCTCNVNGDQVSSLVVVNPSTLQLKLISNSSTTTRLFAYGFAYDSENNDYKVVRIVKESIQIDAPAPTIWQVGVYSLKSNSWKFIDQNFPARFFLHVSGVLINNHMLHWLFYDIQGLVMCFDICTGKWSEVPLPSFNLWDSPGKITAFDDRLCLLNQSNTYLMDAYGVRDSWVKFDWSANTHSSSYYTYPLFYSKSSSEILVVVESRLYWYNSTLKTFSKIQSHNVFHPSSQPIMCTRSLVRLPNYG